MSIDQILNFLGLAMRAGKVKTGESVIVNEIKKGNLKARYCSKTTCLIIQLN